MAKIPINSKMLEWALRDADITAGSAAGITGKPVDTINAWLRGEDYPHKGDLQKLGARTGRSLSFFFLKEPPAPSRTEVNFRRAASGESQDSATELRALRRAGRYQKIIQWAADDEGADPVILPDPPDSPEVFAERMRDHLGWSTAAQVRHSSKSAVYKDLRSRVEDAGIAVLFINAGEGNCRGFSLPNAVAPLVAINSAYRLASLRSYTLLHELAHLAKGVAAVCHDSSRQEERWCDAFAAAFLMPDAHLKAYFERKNWTFVDVSQIDERIRLTSNRYKASWHAVAIRLLRLGLTSQEVVDLVRTSSREADAGFNPNGGRRVPEIRLDEYGTTFTRAVVTLRNEQLLSELDARRYLHVDGEQFSSLKLLASGAA